MSFISKYQNDYNPQLDDAVIGTSISGPPEDNTVNFTFESILNLFLPEITLQQVANQGNTIIVDTDVAQGINITLSNNSTVYQNGIIVTVPAQTGEYPQYQPAPDAFIAYLNGQNPGTLVGQPVGFVSDMSGADNIGFIAQLNGNASNSVGYLSRSYDTHTGNLYEGIKITGGNPSEVFKVDNNGKVSATQFRLSELNIAPLSATATGTLGEVRITSAYIYVCIATNTWVRTALTTW